MPEDWAEGILLSDLADEPELSEEFSAIFSRIKGEPAGEEGGEDAAPKPVPHVVLNFQGVTYLNSSHIAQLLRMRKLLEQHGRRLVVCAMNDEVLSMMRLTGLDKVFHFAPDTMTALASVQIEQ